MRHRLSLVAVVLGILALLVGCGESTPPPPTAADAAKQAPLTPPESMGQSADAPAKK